MQPEPDPPPDSPPPERPVLALEDLRAAGLERARAALARGLPIDVVDGGRVVGTLYPAGLDNPVLAAIARGLDDAEAGRLVDDAVLDVALGLQRLSSDPDPDPHPVRLRWTDRAREDLAAVAPSDRIALRARLRNALPNPALGRRVPEVDREDLREVVEPPCRAVYLVDAQGIVVLAVLPHEPPSPEAR